MYTLITGCAGYIGSHITKILYNTHKDLIIIDNLITGKLSNCKYGIFINADITDVNDIESKVFISSLELQSALLNALENLSKVLQEKMNTFDNEDPSLLKPFLVL